MKILTEIQNWLEEFKNKYKPIGIYPLPKDPENPEEYYQDLDVENEEANIEMAVNSVEELGFLISYLRSQPGVRVLAINEFELASYDPSVTSVFYDDPEVLYNSIDMTIIGNNLSIRIQKTEFPKFWNNFLYEFLIPCKYLPRSLWFLDLHKKHDL